VGYAFVDLSTPSEAERAITELNGQTILERKVSIQLARKPEHQAEGVTEAASSEKEHRPSTRGRGGRGGRATTRGRGGRATRAVS
jgi:RNA recognition motif-containing protein